MSTSNQQLAIEGVYNDILTLVPGTISGSFGGGDALSDSDVYKLRVVTFLKPPLTRYPAIVVGCPLDEPETWEEALGSNETDSIGYPVMVGLFAPNVTRTAPGVETFALDADSDMLFGWRNILMRRYHNKVPAAVSTAATSCVTCRVEPRQILDLSEFNTNLLASALLIRVVCEQSRT